MILNDDFPRNNLIKAVLQETIFNGDFPRNIFTPKKSNMALETIFHAIFKTS